MRHLRRFAGAIVERISPAKLSVRLISLVLLALFPGLALTFYTADHQRHTEAAHVRAQALLLARLASADQEGLVAETRELLSDLAQRRVIRTVDLRTCGALLARVLTQHPAYTNFGMLAPNGDVICNAHVLTRRINSADRSYFRRAMASKDFAVGDYQIGRVTRKAAVNFAYPVLSAGGQVKAVLFASLDLAWINRLAARAPLPSGTTITLVDRHGTVLARYPDPATWLGRMTPQAGILPKIVTEPEGAAEARSADGIVHVVGFARLRGANEDVYLSVSMPVTVAYADANRTFTGTLLALGVVGLLTLFVAWRGGSRYVVRPVDSVVTAAKRLAGGDLSARTGMLPMRGELGQLMRTFDEMAGILERQTGHIQRQFSRLAALRTIDIAITGTRDLQTILNVLLEQVTGKLGVDAADVLLPDPGGQTLSYAAARGFTTPALQYTRVRFGEGHAGRAVRDRQIVGVADIKTQEGDLGRAPLLSEEAFVAYFAAPLIAKDRVVGVLEVFHRAALAPNKEWMEFLEALAGQTAIAIDNAALFSDLERSNAELSRAYDTTLEGWARALDLRDKETEGHSRRVTELTLRLARTIGVAERDLVHIRRGALLHDIGKLGIPDSILLKPGPLTDEEWVIMRRHPTYAYELLSPIEYLRPALDIPYCHHEKWDGTGYPRGLTGEQIPRAARIFAAADVWDALRSERPYRRAWGEEKTREYILANSGTHFEPRVVESLLDQLTRIPS